MRLSPEQTYILEKRGVTRTIKILALLDLSGYTDREYMKFVASISHSTLTHTLTDARNLSAEARREAEIN